MMMESTSNGVDRSADTPSPSMRDYETSASLQALENSFLSSVHQQTHEQERLYLPAPSDDDAHGALPSDTQALLEYYFGDEEQAIGSEEAYAMDLEHVPCPVPINAQAPKTFPATSIDCLVSETLKLLKESDSALEHSNPLPLQQRNIWSIAEAMDMIKNRNNLALSDSNGFAVILTLTSHPFRIVYASPSIFHDVSMGTPLCEYLSTNTSKFQAVPSVPAHCFLHGKRVQAKLVAVMDKSNLVYHAVTLNAS